MTPPTAITDDTDSLSPYRSFRREEWAGLRADAPLTLNAEDLERLRSLNDPISIEEVVEIYLPLSRLLSFYVAATQGLFKATQRFLTAERGEFRLTRLPSGGTRLEGTTCENRGQHADTDLPESGAHARQTQQLARRSAAEARQRNPRQTGSLGHLNLMERRRKTPLRRDDVRTVILDAETVPAIDVTAARVVPDRGRGRQARANIAGAVEADDDAGRG